MIELQLYFWFIIGILLSVLVPIAGKWLREFREETSKGVRDMVITVWPFAKPYVKIAAASAIMGVFLLAVFHQGVDVAKDFPWFDALLYGYAWDSTFQKFATTS